jgi:hypothetical protein
MAVSEGRNGNISVVQGASSGIRVNIAEMGSWSVGGMSRNMIDYTAFGDTVSKYKPGMLDPGELTFEGFYDKTDTTGQGKLITALSSGGTIDNSTYTTADKLRKLRLYANDDTSFDGYGAWSCTGSSGELFITSFESETNKDGIATVRFTAKVSKGALSWTTLKSTQI